MCTQYNGHFLHGVYRIIGNHQYKIQHISILEHLNSHQNFILYGIIVNIMSCHPHLFRSWFFLCILSRNFRLPIYKMDMYKRE